LTGRQATWAGLLIVTAACAKLPSVPAGECGNGVVEAPREDCDGFAGKEMSCRPKGSAGECHFDCKSRSDGPPLKCPAGWGCDLDGLCRMPSGEFEPPLQSRIAGAWTLQAGDFDGDGRTDVVGQEPLDLLGRTKLRIHYADPQGAVGDSRAFPKQVGVPVIVDLTGDDLDDLVLTNSALAVLIGQADRSWLPESFGSYQFPDSTIRMIAVSDVPMIKNSAVVVLASVGGVPGLYVSSLNQSLEGLARLGDLPGGLEELAGDPVSGDLIVDPLGSPCRELVIARRGATAFSIIDSCQRLGSGDLTWRERAQVSSVSLEPAAAIESGAQLADVDGDGHLDVMLAAGGRAYVSYGDGHKLSPAQPYRHSLGDPNDDRSLPMPLAVGDYTGDGIEDFVFPDHLLLSIRVPGTPSAVYKPYYPGLAAAWTVARIADVNGNGKPDVVAASSNGFGIDFFNGTGTENLLPFQIPTDGPVLHLQLGDMDGDLIDDLSFVEKATSAAERDSVRVAFGTLGGFPTAPSAVARMRHVEQLAFLYEGGQGGLMLASNETIAGHQNGVLTVLGGSTDRIPYAPLQLVDISAMEGLRISVAMASAVGAFTAPGQHDVLAMGSDGDPSRKSFVFWLMPALSTTQNNRALRVGGRIDPRLLPAQGLEPRITINLATASADVDGDGRDEGFFAMPAQENERCGVMVVGLAPQSPPQAMVRDTLMLDERCFRPEVSAVDADGDGRPDLVLLTGAPGEKTRKLLVLWNDGKGGFSTARMTLISGTDSPQQFTSLKAVPTRPFSFAYATASAAMIASTRGLRQFEPAKMLTSLPGGSGIVAADVNGDGVQDLVLAASGNLSVWKARLRTP
jgi:hypothetical protein